MSVQSSQIPDLLKIGSIPVNTAQDVETSVLEPVVHNDNFCRFVFQNKGILHSHSKIELAVEGLDGQDPHRIYIAYPLGVGVYGLIDRVALKIGTKTICEIEDFANYFAYKSMFVPPEHNKEREGLLSGRCLAWKPAYDNGADVAHESQGGFESNTSAVGMELDLGMYSSSEKGTESNINQDDNLLVQYSVNGAEHFGGVKGNQVALSELCPFLKMNQLPLFMIKEQVSLEIHFTKNGAGGASVGVGSQGVKSNMRVVCGGVNTPYSFPIDTSRTKLVADYIFYPQELMEQYRNANKNMSFTYVDYRLSKMSVDKATASSGMIRNIGGAGRIVSKVFWGLQDQEQSSNNLLGNYYSQAPARDYDNADPALRNNGTATMNIKYNDNFLFPIDVSNSSRHFHNVQQTEGLVPFVPRECYALEGQCISDRFCLERHQGGLPGTQEPAGVAGNFANLPGKFNWYAMRLNKNERINSRGIELYFKYSELPAPQRVGVAEDTPGRGYVQRCWLEVVRTATLSDGYVQCYYA